MRGICGERNNDLAVVGEWDMLQQMLNVASV